jgi:ubiquinone/menaquinone biosynthesis C-methylase UbiE
MDVNMAVRAFDRLAPHYDEACDGALFRWMRDQVHAVLGPAFRHGDRVLEIGCGSGADTAFLAARQVDVVAADPAPGMITHARGRLERVPSRGSVQFVCCGLNDIEAHLAPAAAFDGIFSDFGALNCVPRLEALASLAARRLKPGGRVIVCLMSPACAIEMGWFLLRGAPRQAFRRLGRPPVMVDVEGLRVPTYYHRVRDVQAALGPAFVLRRVTGLSVFVPPPYLEARWAALPAPARRALEGVDRALASRWPFNRLGDHTLVEFEDVRM